MSEEAFHPIIEAMIASANSKDRALALAQKDQTDKEEADFRRKQLAATLKHFDDEHQINLGQLGIAQKHYDLMLKEFRSKAQQQILSNIKEGSQSVDTLPPAPSIPTALNSQPDDPSQTVTASPASVAPTPQFSQMPQPGPSSSQDGNVDVGGQSMSRAAVAQIPIRVAAQKGAVAKATAQAVVDAQQPEREALEKQRSQDRVDQLAAQADARSQQLEDQRRFLAHESDLNRQNRLDLVHAHVAGVQHGVDPDDVQSLMEQGSTGEADLSGSTRPVLAARTAMEGAGRKPFSTKDAASLKASAGLQSWIGQLRAFANKLPDSKIAAGFNGVVNSSPLYKTDLANQYDQIQTGLITAGKALEGISGGRITIPQMKKLEQGASGMNITRSQALLLADGLESKLHQQVDTNLLGGIGETQRQLIFHRQGVTPESLGLKGSPSTNTQLPDFLKMAPPKNGRGTPLNIQESIQAGSPVYGSR